MTAAATDEPRLRDATPADLERIAALHLASWRTAYRGVLPDAYLDGPAAAEGLAHWQAVLPGLAAPDFVLLAEEGHRLAGFVSAHLRGHVRGHRRDDTAGEAEIAHLHVDPVRRGAGIGRRLLGAAAGRMIASGCRRLSLWVFDDNRAALGFYRSLGGRAIERGADDFLDPPVPHTRLAWDDLPALARACDRP